MFPEQTAAYLARFRDRIATIRQNVTATSLKGRFTNSIRRRDSLGRRGENARTVLSASLGLYYTGVDKSEEDLRDLSPVDWDDGDEDDENDGDGDGGDCDSRSDSMEPLRDSSREDINDGTWDGQWELDIDREEEQLMRSEHRIAEERSLGGDADGEREQYVAYHSLNSGAARRMRLESVQRMYEGGGRYSTVGRKKGRELQSMLRDLGAEDWNGEAQDEEVPYEEAQDGEAQDEEQSHFGAGEEEDSISLPSNPYPEDDFLFPLTRQQARTTPPPPLPSPTNLIIVTNSSPELSIPSPGLSIPSNPYPEDAPPSPTSSSQPPPPPPRPTQSPSPFYRAITPPTPRSRFPIYPCDRTISPISPFNASRHLISAEGTTSTQRYRIDHRQEENDGYDDNDVEGGYAPNHPYHGMSALETSEYWHELEGYHTESERNLRRMGEGRGRRRTGSSPVQYDPERVFGSVGDSYEGGGGGRDGEREDEVRRRYLESLTDEARARAEEEEEEEFAMRTAAEETNAGRKNMMGRLLSTFTCRPGSVTPLHTAVPNPNDANATTTPTIPNPPKKYGLSCLSHKIGRTQKREEEARLRERLLAIRVPESSAPRTQHIEDTSKPTEVPVLVAKPKAKRRKDSTQPNPPSLVPILESRTQSVIGPPVDLSRMIRRAPESIRMPTPLPVSVTMSDVEVSGVEENGKHGPRQEHSGSSLSDRLRQTQLEDLPLQFDAAQEIRNLMRALERDQAEAASTPAQHVHTAPHNPNTNTPPSQKAHELPAGFSTSSAHTQPNLSPHETLERHFRIQRIRPATSHSSNLTLPRSYRVPEGHGGGRGVLRVTNVVVQGEGEGEIIGGIEEGGGGCEEVGVDDRRRNGGGGANSEGLEEDAKEHKTGETSLQGSHDKGDGKAISEAG